MPQRIPLLAPTALALALSLAGTVHAAGEPRVMFVSKADQQPVLIDLQGKQVPARKGAVIPPGFTVMVPEGATVQIMTPERSILAVRPNTLLRVDGIGGDASPYKLTLNRGGVRVANPELNFKKFEIDTPNAKVNFGKGDHETVFLMPGKLKDGRWGTFARGSKDETLVKTRDGDLKLLPREIGHVPGGDKSRPRIITFNEGGKQPQNPVSYTPGAREVGATLVTENFQNLNDPAAGGSDPAARPDPGLRSAAPKASDPIPGLSNYKPTSDLKVAIAVNPLPAERAMPKIDPSLTKANQMIDPSIAKKETLTGVTDKGTFLVLDKMTLTAASKNAATPPPTIDIGSASRNSAATSAAATAPAVKLNAASSLGKLQPALTTKATTEICRKGVTC